MLDDSHTRVLTLSPQGRERIGADSCPTLEWVRSGMSESQWLIRLIDQLLEQLLDEGAQQVGRDRILWGTLGGDIGYLQVFQMGGFIELDIAIQAGPTPS